MSLQTRPLAPVNMGGNQVALREPGMVTRKVTATLAEINAGKTAIQNVAAEKLEVIDFKWSVTGTFLTATLIRLVTNEASPVVVASLAIAGATDGAYIHPTHANITLGAGFLAALAAGAEIVIDKTGSAATGGTSIDFFITYRLKQ